METCVLLTRFGPDAMRLNDQLRLTISVVDPMFAAIVVQALSGIEHFKVISANNK